MKKTPLILIPGLLCDHALWEHQTASLAPIAECSVTDRHLHDESIEQIADAVVAGAPARFALAGLSMGGYIALEICRKYGNRVERLALIDTSARADTSDQTDRRQRLIGLCRQGKFADVNALLFTVLVHPDRSNAKGLKRQIMEMANRTGPEVFIRQQRAIMGRRSQLSNLAGIQCPSLVVCGAQDQITPLECSQEMAERLPNSNLVVLEDCGHMSTMEQPDKVSTILFDWIKSSH